MKRLVTGLLSFLIGFIIGSLGIVKTIEWVVIILASTSLILLGAFWVLSILSLTLILIFMILVGYDVKWAVKIYDKYFQ